MPPTVAASSAPLHRPSGTNNGQASISSASKSATNGNAPGKLAARLQSWTASPSSKPALPKASATPVSKQSSKQPSASSSASSSKTAAMPSTTKKRKRSSPFRIKVGCIVALRYQSPRNHVEVIAPSGAQVKSSQSGPSNSYVEVWADPLPGREEGLALVGRRVRCCFPKSVLSNESNEKVATRRILEGEIVSIVDYETQWNMQRTRRKQREPCGTKVELLVDREALTAMPFLRQIEEVAEAEATISKAEKRRRRYEEIIRGKNKVMVLVTLADTSKIGKANTCGKPKESSEGLEARWVIRKRVPVRLVSGDATNNKGTGDGSKAGKESQGESSSKKPTKRRKANGKKDAASGMRYVGDGNDSPAQQERNWRWLAGRFEDLRLRKVQIDQRSPFDDFSSSLVGEVVEVSPSLSPSSSTLATVTLRRLILPEHTLSGRMSHHNPMGIYDEFDSSVYEKEADTGTEVNGDDSSRSYWTFKVPVEELVIISRRFERRLDGSTHGGGDSSPVIVQSYSARNDAYKPLVSLQKKLGDSSVRVDEGPPPIDNSFETEVCHRCRRTIIQSKMKQCLSNICGHFGDSGEAKSPVRNWWCDECILSLESVGVYTKDKTCKGALPCCCGSCDCAICTSLSGTKLKKSLVERTLDAAKLSRERDATLSESTQFQSACSVIGRVRPVDFDLSGDLMDLSSIADPSETPVSVVKKRGVKKRPRKATGKSTDTKKKRTAARSPGGQPKLLVETNEPTGIPSTKEEYDVFKPTCCRLIPYDPEKKRFHGVPNQQVTRQDPDVRTGMQGRAVQRRDAVRSGGRQNVRSRGNASDRVEKKTTNSRAARANQRRMMKDVAAFGATSLSLDTLAGREQQLRFDKSLIHAWGVFADEKINSGEMIVEYRGELIGNSVAEKREKEYEHAKIGSDYMFRIDAHTVCDATKQGNVARFINASCNPNCYTKITTVSGVKRIVIYAKRDIKAGEELCYDYKFPLEFDETKRIKCYCGAPDCRGFMNWDKRYVALPLPPEHTDSDVSLLKQAT